MYSFGVHDRYSRITTVAGEAKVRLELSVSACRHETCALRRHVGSDSHTAGQCRAGIGRARSTYVRRRPEETVLHQVVGAHLETFLAEVRLRSGGDGLPRFVERELREYLTCGVMARGFARFRCRGCAREILVAFSCKGRGFCPSCCGRRMGALAAHLVDGVLRLGADPNAAVVTTGGPRHARSVGFDLHANVAVPAGERTRLEHLCRYVLRPPLAQEALELTSDGKVLLRLRRPWRDGTRAILFEPTELLERLAAMVPRPRTNLLIYHGAFAPRGCRRVAAALAGKRAEDLRTQAGPTGEGGSASDSGRIDRMGVSPKGNEPGGGDASGQPRPPPTDASYVRPRHFAWADLLRRTFEVDVLACPDCGGRLRLLATIEDSEVIAKILRHLELPVDAPEPTPARALDWLPGFVAGAE